MAVAVVAAAAVAVTAAVTVVEGRVAVLACGTERASQSGLGQRT